MVSNIGSSECEGHREGICEGDLEGTCEGDWEGSCEGDREGDREGDHEGDRETLFRDPLLIRLVSNRAFDSNFDSCWVLLLIRQSIHPAFHRLVLEKSHSCVVTVNYGAALDPSETPF